jgi:PAS domain S-box-containing protein
LLLAMAVLGATGWTVYQNWSEARVEAEITRSNRAYLRTINNVLAEIDDAESGQRGYLLTGREHYLQPYEKALNPLRKDLNALQKMGRSRPQDQETIEHLVSVVHTKISELAATIALRQNKGVDAAMAEILTDKGNASMDEIRRICQAAADKQRTDVAAESSQAERHQLAAIRLSAGGGVLLLGLMVAGLAALNSGAREQMRLAEGLAQSRELFETTLNSIGDGVVATDTAGRITFINPEAVRLTGWARADAVGKSLKDVFRIVNESSREEVESPFDKVMRTGSAVGLANHTTLVRRDGSEVAIDDSGAPIRNSYGKVSGVVLIFRDITERRKSEAALAQSHSEVLMANEELRQFSYAATHDLQEPLRTIVVFSQLLGRSYRGILDERGRHLLQTVEDAALRMSTLIEHLLAYTRVGGMDSSGTRVAVDSKATLEDTLVQLKGAIEETKAAITFDVMPAVWAEPGQLNQVFLNLISNAIKYRKPNEAPVIHVTASAADGMATFQVSDNGIGFRQEYSDRIFLLFQRLHGRSIPGTGIGLALCRRIVERLGGKIWVTSEENVGSTFYFTLPVADEEAVKQALK